MHPETTTLYVHALPADGAALVLLTLERHGTAAVTPQEARELARSLTHAARVAGTARGTQPRGRGRTAAARR